MNDSFSRVLSLIGLFIFCAQVSLHAAQHRELGEVKWLRDYNAALAQAGESGKPVLILFQEVPGCSGCQSYGQGTLSDPIIVDAIEGNFVPLAIFNNKGGKDREVLEHYKEPAFNYQVMRFVDAKGKDIIPRHGNVWHVEDTATLLAEALKAYQRPVPPYLTTVLPPSADQNIQTAAFSVFCFWDGEAKLGGIAGVLETEAGWLEGREVVKLSFDANVISWSDLVLQAKAMGCAQHVYKPGDASLANYRKAKDSDQKRHLQASALRDMYLNNQQATKINAALSKGDKNALEKWLSPSQWEQARKLLSDNGL